MLALAGCGDSDGNGAASNAALDTPPAATVTAVAEPVAEPPAPLERGDLTLPQATPVQETQRAPAAVADAAGVYAGTGEAVEGDVLAIGRTRFLLYGIDTVEPAQMCSINGEPWECWPAVVRALQTVLSEGEVRCTPTGGGDPFGRFLAMCEINGQSLNRRMVELGFAIAVPDEMPEYVAVETEARTQRIGLWQGTFQDPAEYRAARGIVLRRP